MTRFSGRFRFRCAQLERKSKQMDYTALHTLTNSLDAVAEANRDRLIVHFQFGSGPKPNFDRVQLWFANSSELIKLEVFDQPLVKNRPASFLQFKLQNHPWRTRERSSIAQDPGPAHVQVPS